MNKFIISLAMISLLSLSCQKNDLTVYHSASYNVVKPEGVVIDTIFYKDAHGNMQTIAKPFGRVYLLLKVAEGFHAEMRVKGTLPDSSFCTMTITHAMGQESEENMETITQPGSFDITLNMLIE